MTDAATTTTTAAATTTAADTTTAATTTAAAPWHGIADPEVAAYVDTKGWKAPADVVQSYKNAEKLIGRDPNTLLSIPRADDPDGFRSVMAKLGMPDAPEKYEISAPEGGKVDEVYAGWAKGTFHKLGLTAAQAKTLTAEHNQFIATALAAQEKDYNDSVAADKQALLAEWRDGHDRMMNSAKASAKALGFEQPVIDAIEKSVGYAKTMKLFAELGKRLSEDGFVGSGTGKGIAGMQTPAEAKAEWEAMKVDPVHSKALFDNTHPGHKAATEKQKRLFATMYPQ